MTALDPHPRLADYRTRGHYEQARERWQQRQRAQTVALSMVTPRALEEVLSLLGLTPAPGQHLMELTIKEGTVRARYEAVRVVEGEP